MCNSKVNQFASGIHLDIYEHLQFSHEQISAHHTAMTELLQVSCFVVLYTGNAQRLQH